jgi:hypothetical protein
MKGERSIMRTAADSDGILAFPSLILLRIRGVLQR